jgi:DNA-binding MarR family transcriptional regulator
MTRPPGLRPAASPPGSSASADAERLCELLLRLGRQRSVRNPVAVLCEELQLTPSQLHSLVWLGHEGPLAMGDLARRLGVTVKTVTGVVDRLERTGLAQRVRASGDRRVVQVALSAQGTEVFGRLKATARERLQQVLGQLDASQRAALFSLLEGLAARLEARGDPTA